MLVVLEGIDGAGTTTQAKRLVEALNAEKIPAHFTGEPSRGPVGVLLRKALEDPQAALDPSTMGLLFAADRADHLHREIEPALARGEIVVSDRYYHSSLAYQGADVDRQWILMLNQRARRPDLTLILEVSVAVAEARRNQAGRRKEAFDATEMQTRVAKNYRMIKEWLGEKEKIVTIDGEQSADQVFADILQRVLSLRAEKR
jgi:dTMP kinase